MNSPISQISLTLQMLMINRKPISSEHFYGRLRLSEYIRLLRRKYFLDIKTIPVKFKTQFGQNSEYATYKLKSKRAEAIKVYNQLLKIKKSNYGTL